MTAPRDDGAGAALRNGAAIEVASLAPAPFPAFRETVVRAAASGRRIVAMFGLPDERGLRIVALIADDAAGSLLCLTTQPGDRYPSLTPDCPQAHLFEREILEQHGVTPDGHPWLKPLRRHDGVYPFFAVEGDEIHEVAVGPVHAGVIDAGHFRLQCHGETVISLEIHLGYQHRGVEEALAGGPDRRSALLAECLAGDTTVGHALAHAELVEALAGAAPPPRAAALRAVALELERLASHAGDLGALSGDIGFLPAAAWFGRLRGEFLNLLAALTGSRFGRGLIRPGGVMFDLPPAMRGDLARRLDRARSDLRDVAGIFFGRPSVRSRLEGTGTLSPAACAGLGLLGPPARACGLTRDVRHDHPAGLYREARPVLATVRTGDVLARAQVRWREIEASGRFLAERFETLPDGPLRAECGAPRPGRLAVSMVEGWRGEIVHVAVTGAAGRFTRYKVKDPSFQNWPGLALAMRGAPISDFPLCNKSFNLSYAGNDL